MFNLLWPYILLNIGLFLPFLVLLWICFKAQCFLLKMGLPSISKLHFGGYSALWVCNTISYPLWWGGRGDNVQRCSHYWLVQYCNCVVTGGKCCWPNMLWEGQHPVIAYWCWVPLFHTHKGKTNMPTFLSIDMIKHLLRDMWTEKKDRPASNWNWNWNWNSDFKIT